MPPHHKVRLAKLNTYPDREGIETRKLPHLIVYCDVEYLPRPRGD